MKKNEDPANTMRLVQVLNLNWLCIYNVIKIC